MAVGVIFNWAPDLADTGTGTVLVRFALWTFSSGDASKHPARYFLVELGDRGRESFSGRPLPMWQIVGRKRLPTPLHPTSKANINDKKLVAGCLLSRHHFPPRNRHDE